MNIFDKKSGQSISLSIIVFIETVDSAEKVEVGFDPWPAGVHVVPEVGEP